MEDHEDAPNSTLLALSIALEHPAFSSSPRILCSAAAVCNDWRQAVQQLAGCSTDVHFKLRSNFSTTVDLPSQLLARLAGFSSWLAKHGPLVRSLTVDGWQFALPDTITIANATALQLLRSSMQLAAATRRMHPATATQRSVDGNTAAGAAAAAAAASTTASVARRSGPLLLQQQHPGMRLSSFSSDATWAVGLLPLLPAHSLTRLELDLQGDRHALGAHRSSDARAAAAADAASRAAAVAAALPRLSSLQQLALRGNPTWVTQGEARLDSCLAVLGQLSRLTRLKVSSDVWGREEALPANSALQQLLAQPPPQLQELHLDLDASWYPDGTPMPPPLDMGRLHQLQQLVCLSEVPEQSVLPAQLRQLTLRHGWPDYHAAVAAAMQLQQLTAFSLRVGEEEQQESLLRLAQLPALQELRLEMGWEAAVNTTPAWKQLQQLCSLEVDDDGSEPSGRDVAAVLAQVGAATGLTKLDLQVPYMHDPELEAQATAGVEEAQQQAPLDICASIAGLTRLKHLELDHLSLVIASDSLTPGLVSIDACALTALTGLTHLGLGDGGACVGDLAAVALACCLKQLRHLELYFCELGSMRCLGAIAHLPQLSELRASGRTAGVTQQGLMMLTRLSRLQVLSVDRQEEVTDAVMDTFWSTLRGGGGP